MEVETISLKSIGNHDRLVKISYYNKDEEELFEKLESIGIKVERRRYGW